MARDREAGHSSGTVELDEWPPSISVVIQCGAGEAELLEGGLRAVNGQRLLPLDVLVAFSGVSSADVGRWRQSFRAALSAEIALVVSDASDASSGANRRWVAEVARGTIVSFFDAGAAERSDRLSTIAAAFRDPSIMAVYHRFTTSGDSRVPAPDRQAWFNGSDAYHREWVSVRSSVLGAIESSSAGSDLDPLSAIRARYGDQAIALLPEFLGQQITRTRGSLGDRRRILEDVLDRWYPQPLPRMRRRDRLRRALTDVLTPLRGAGLQSISSTPRVPGAGPIFSQYPPGRISLDSKENREARQSSIELSEKIIAQFEARKADRHRALGAILSARNRRNAVLLMTSNAGHADLLHNWLRSCELHDIRAREWAVVIALDRETRDRCIDLGLAVYYDSESYGNPPSTAARAYGDETFMRLMFPKTGVVEDGLELGYDILFQDVDLVWMRDPLPRLRHWTRRRCDAQFMYDGPNRRYQPVHANTGFFFLRNTPASRRCWRLAFDNFDKMLYYRSQQMAVNQILVNQCFRGLQVDILSDREFANGHQFTPSDASKLPPHPYVVHASWTSNVIEKIEKLKTAGLWYL